MITHFDWFCFEPLILNSLHGDTGYSLPRRKNHGWKNLCLLSESVSEFTQFRLNIRQLVRLSKKSFSKLFFPYFCFVDPANHPQAVDTRSSYNFVVRNDQRWQSFHHTVVTFSDSQKGILIRTPQFLWSVILISILPEYFRARLVLVSFEGLRVIPYDRINQSEGAAVSQMDCMLRWFLKILLKMYCLNTSMLFSGKCCYPLFSSNAVTSQFFFSTKTQFEQSHCKMHFRKCLCHTCIASLL